MILSFQTDMPGQSSLIRVYTVCHSVCIVWTHYSMVEPHSSNFRVITTNLLGVRIFRKFKVYVKQVQNVLITGDSRYVDFAYLDTITYVEVIFHSQNVSLYIFAFQLRLCRKWLTWSNGHLEVIFHALDIFSVIFATSYVEDKNRHSHGRRIVCFGNVQVLPEVRKSSKQK